MTYDETNFRHPFDPEPSDGGQSSVPTRVDSSTAAALIGDGAALREALMIWCDALRSFDERAIGLKQIETAKKAVAEVQDELTDQLAAEIDSAWVETPVGILKRDKRGGYSSWDADAIWSLLLAYVRANRFDPATGELRDMAEVMLSVIKDVIASPSFKVTALKRYGVDVDEVRATSPVRKIVRFVDQ